MPILWEAVCRCGGVTGPDGANGLDVVDRLERERVMLLGIIGAKCCEVLAFLDCWE